MVLVEYPGVLSNALVAVETTYGTAVAATLSPGLVHSIKTNEKNNIERIPGLGARNIQAQVAKMYDASVTLDGVWTTSRLLAYGIGNWASTDNSTINSSHAITESNTLPSLTLESSFANGTSLQGVKRTYAGLLIDKLKLSLGTDQVMRFTADCNAATVSYSENATPTAAAFPTTTTNSLVIPALGPQFATVKIDGTNASALVQNFEFSVDNSPEYIPALGSRLKQAAVAKQRLYSIGGKVVFSQVAAAAAVTDTVVEYIRRFLADATTPLTPATSITTTDGNIFVIDNGLTTESENKLSINTNGFIIDEANIDVPVDGLVTLDFTAYATAVNTSIIGVDGTLKAGYSTGGNDRAL